MLIGSRILIPLDKNAVTFGKQKTSYWLALKILVECQGLPGKRIAIARQARRARARLASWEQLLSAQERAYRIGSRPQRGNDLRERKQCQYRQNIPRFCRKHRHPSRRLDNAAQLRWEPLMLETTQAGELMRARPRRRQQSTLKKGRATSLGADGHHRRSIHPF